MQDLSKIRAEPTEATGRSQCPGFSEQICCPWLTASSVCVCTAVSGKKAGPGCHGYEHTGPGLGVLLLGALHSSNLVPRRQWASDGGAHPQLSQPLGSERLQTQDTHQLNASLFWGGGGSHCIRQMHSHKVAQFQKCWIPTKCTS